jgi:peptide/nickel transport system substrate-binding protein
MKKYIVPLVLLMVLSLAVPVHAAASQASITPIAAAQRVAVSPAVAAASALDSAAQPAIKPATSQYGGALRWIESTGPSNPIGAIWESPLAHTSQQMAFDTLLKESADGSLAPWLVSSYEVNTDAANPFLTLHLRKGVKFQDGSDFNAQALKWNIQKLIDSGLFASVKYFKSLDIFDDYSLHIPLTQWRNSLLPSLAKPQHWVVSPTAYQTNGLDWIRTHMVGTGPFVQSGFQRDISLSGQRNTNYWVNSTPYLDGIQYLFVSDQLTREALFRSGGAEVYNTAGNARQASNLAGLAYPVISQTASAMVLLPDSANPDSPWSNLKARQAVEYAIDKEAIARAFGYGYWQAANQAASPGAPAYAPGIAGRKYDVMKAKILMTEAGYPNGFKTSIIAQYGSNIDVLTTIQSYLAKVGINAVMQIVQPADMGIMQSNGWVNGLLFTSIGFEGNIVPTMDFNFPPVRTGRYSVVARSSRWTELYNTIGATPLPSQSIMQQVSQDVYDFNMWIPLYYYPDLWVTRQNVQDTGLGALQQPFWNTHQAWLGQPATNGVPLSLTPTAAGPVGPGQVFNLDIKTNVAGNQPVSGVDAFIKYDPAKLEVIDADAGQAGIQITPGTSLDTVITNNADNTGGLISYSAGKLGAPFPASPFTVASIPFRVKNVLSPVTTRVTISLSGNATTSMVDFGGTPIAGTSQDASVQIVTGASVTFKATLQGGSRPESGWAMPLTIKFFTHGAGAPVDFLTAEPINTFYPNAARNGSYAAAQVTGVPLGTYDISLSSPHCLINVKRGVTIATFSTIVDMGALLEGDANNDNIINIQDFGLLAAAYGKSSGATGFDARADFDRNGVINIADFRPAGGQL